ncbi:MAG TPA: hypothetical protein VD704_07670 [Gaiellaceae bacterium]|nr:hypothetical protein [Gaiellaceae bacterium]
MITLFDEYAARWARGEAPDAREYLARAGPAAGELADLLDRFLASAPPGEPDPELAASFAAWAAGEPPLLVLRVRRGVRREAIVEAIVERFALAEARRPKVGRYVHRLETGQLDARGVDPGVLEAWAGVLRARVEDLLAWRPEPAPRTAASYLRAADPAAADALAPPTPADERDEVDELFARGQ